MSHEDGSRIEAAEAGSHGAHAVHGSHDSHEAHDAHDAAAGGHGADPNAGVFVAVPPTPAWVLTAAGIAAVTIAVCLVLAFILADKVG